MELQHLPTRPGAFAARRRGDQGVPQVRCSLRQRFRQHQVLRAEHVARPAGIDQGPTTAQGDEH